MTNTYKNIKGQSVEFNYNGNLTLSQKASFVIDVAGMLVSNELGYIGLLKEYIFNYYLIKYFTDITIFTDDEKFDLDELERFMKANGKEIIGVISAKVGSGFIKELEKSCDDAIKFRKSHLPDRWSELLETAAKVLNKFADKDNIDFSMVEKLAGIIPVMQEMHSPEVAKTIVKEFHGRDNKDVVGDGVPEVGVGNILKW